LNDRVVRRRYQFIDQRRRRFAIPKVRPDGSEWDFRKHESGTPEVGRTDATECMPRKLRHTGLQPPRLIAHATFERRRPITLHEIMTAVEQQ
jgi:hypothetical protein